MDGQYGGNHGGGGGGFNYAATDPMMNNGGGTPSSGTSPGGGTRRKAYDEQTLIPITIRMALNAQTHNTPGGGSEGFILSSGNGNDDGRVLHAVKIVAAVRDVAEQSTSVSYDLEDGTGLIQVKQWHDQQENSGITEMRMECKEKVYVRVIGQLREYDGHRHIVAHSIRKVSTPNEITHHFLECIASMERHRRGGTLFPNKVGVGMGVGASNGNGGMVKNEYGRNPVYDRPPQSQPHGQGMNNGPGGRGAPLQANGGGNHGGGGGDGCDEVVVEYIKMHGQSDIGADVEEMIVELDRRHPGRYGPSRIRKAVETLAVDGHIYSTVDESKYKYAED